MAHPTVFCWRCIPHQANSASYIDACELAVATSQVCGARSAVAHLDLCWAVSFTTCQYNKVLSRLGKLEIWGHTNILCHHQPSCTAAL